MATKPHGDNESFIVESIFKAAFEDTQVKYGTLSETRTRQLLYAVMGDSSNAPFPAKLSRAKTVVNVPERERSRYHSFATRYFKRAKEYFAKRSPEELVTSQEVFEAIAEEESTLMSRERNEHIIDADGNDLDWLPEYDGTTW